MAESITIKWWGGTVNCKVDKTLNAGKGVQTTVHLGFKPTYVAVIKNNGNMDVVAIKTIFTDGTEKYGNIKVKWYGCFIRRSGYNNYN